LQQKKHQKWEKRGSVEKQLAYTGQKVGKGGRKGIIFGGKG